MILENLETLAELIRAAQELRAELDKAREILTDEDFEAGLDGAFGDVLAAAMEVEDYIDQLEA